MKAGRTPDFSGRLGRHALTGVAIALAAGSCAPAYNAPPVGAPLVAVSNAPQSRLQRGYEIHQTQCAKCHPFEDPANYDEIDLAEDIMPVMARKANLDRADQEAVLAYLLAARKVQPSR
jgi:mono/diheme cytochrome c family protein